LNAAMQRLLFFLAGLLGKPLIAFYYSTVHIVNDPQTQRRLRRNPGPSGVYAFWHSHQLSACWHFRRSRAGIIISASKDGEYIARIASALGYLPVRGSSSRRGAEGLRGLMELAQTGRPVAVTPDGPRGPRHAVHPGVLAVAQKTGYAVTPVAVGFSSFWELPSWDRFRIPKPFARGYNLWGEPLHVPTDADEEALETLGGELRARMIALEELADRRAKDGPFDLAQGRPEFHPFGPEASGSKDRKGG